MLFVLPRAWYFAQLCSSGSPASTFSYLCLCNSHLSLLINVLCVRCTCRWAFFLSGGVQIVYDLLLLWSFSSLKADHEQKL